MTCVMVRQLAKKGMLAHRVVLRGDTVNVEYDWNVLRQYDVRKRNESTPHEQKVRIYEKLTKTTESKMLTFLHPYRLY